MGRSQMRAPFLFSQLQPAVPTGSPVRLTRVVMGSHGGAEWGDMGNGQGKIF